MPNEIENILQSTTSNISNLELEQLRKDLNILKFQMQETNDTLYTGIRSSNIKEFRNTYVINAHDSLDATYPMYVNFNIISEMVKIVSVKVDFWILPFRAYSTANANNTQQTSSTQAEATSSTEAEATSSSVGTPSGGGTTASSASGDYEAAPTPAGFTAHDGGYLLNDNSTTNFTYPSHTHTTPAHTHPAHTHTVAAHSHTVAAHSHTVAAHTHGITYGIYEEVTSPTIKFYISENAGVSYNDTFFGGYTTDKSALDITSLITTAGSKLIKFTSDLRARLSIQIEIKLDISAR